MTAKRWRASSSATLVFLALKSLQRGAKFLIGAVAIVLFAGVVVIQPVEAQSSPIGDWSVWEPRALNASRPHPMSFTMKLAGATRVVVSMEGRPEEVELDSLGNGLFRKTFSAEQILYNWHDGDIQVLVGTWRAYRESVPTLYGPFVANVRPVEAPDVPVEVLAEDIQWSPHVVNFRVNEPMGPMPDRRELVRRFYKRWPDIFDFLAIVSERDYVANRTYSSIRNDVDGIGLQRFDESRNYGSDGRLQGILNYPMDTLFDGGSTAFNHEVGHRWGVFIRHPDLLANRPLGAHWPISTMASGVMGFDPFPGGPGGDFPKLKRTSVPGTFQMLLGEWEHEFNDLDLYLMGLLPPEQVPTQYIFYPSFAWQNAYLIAQVTRGTVLGLNYISGGKPFTVQDVILAEGKRSPAFGTAQTGFRTAFIVLSEGRLLDSNEMAHFDYAAARAEGDKPNWVVQGFLRRPEFPFHLATRRRATMSASLSPNMDTTSVLRVIKTGSGVGTVSSNPSGISCGSGCSSTYPLGATVTLTATPAEGSRFTGWSGACSGTSSCVLVMNDPEKIATASFLSVSHCIGRFGLCSSVSPGIWEGKVLVPMGVASGRNSSSLASGSLYRLEASGVYKYEGAAGMSDAKCRASDPTKTWTEQWNNDHGLLVDGAMVAWAAAERLPGCSQAHVYDYVIVGEGRHLNFRARDWNHSDNSGYLIVDIYRLSDAAPPWLRNL